MNWSSFYRKQSGLPGWVALPILLGLFVGLFFAGNKIMTNTFPLISKASEEFSVDKIIIGNLQHNSATVYWQTKVPAITWLRYKKTSDSDWKTIKDARDMGIDMNLRRNHLATLVDLEAASEYQYEIVNDKVKLSKHNGEDLIFRTANNLKSANNANPVYGKLVTTTNLSVEGAVVLFESADTIPLITTSKSDGSFIFSTCCLVNKNTKDGPVILPIDKVVKISFYDDKYKNTVIEVPLKDTSPLLASVVMGGENQQLMASSDANTLGVVNIDGTNSDQGKTLTGQLPDALVVDYPKSGKSIPGTKPLFSGVGVVGKSIRINLVTEKKEFEVTPTADGKWQFSPKFDMKIGSQLVVISQRDAKNKLIEQKISFFIQKSGEAVLGRVLQATDEAGITLTPIPTAIVVSTTPTSIPSPTNAINDTPIFTATPAPPESGVDTILPYSMIGMGLLLFGAVVVLGL